MRPVWYDRQGPAAEVLQAGELPDPEPGPGEVRVRVRFSGVDPGDTKERRGWLGSSMPHPRVIPHSDAAGVADAVGAGVASSGVGRRVWVHGARSYRPFGTAAEYTVVPEALAVDLPDAVSDEVGACLGIPGVTTHRAVFGDGPVTAPPCSCTACSAESAASPPSSPPPWPRWAPSSPPTRPVTAGRACPSGRSCSTTSPSGCSAATTSPPAAEQQAAADLTTVARDGALAIAVGRPLPLASAAEAHERVDAGTRARVLLAIDD